MGKPEYIVLQKVTATRRVVRPAWRGELESDDVATNYTLQSGELSRREREHLGKVPDTYVARSLPIRCVLPVRKSGLWSSLLSGKAGDSTWGVKAVGANRYVMQRNSRVKVAVLDTGIDRTHEAFQGIKLQVKSFVNGPPDDHNGHGTHCAGNIFGKIVKTTKRYSIAPGVQHALIGKILEDDASGSTKALAKGLFWALTEGAHIINASVSVDYTGHLAALAQNLPAESAASFAQEEFRDNIRLFDNLVALLRPGPLGSAVLIAAAGNQSHREDTPPLTTTVGPPAAAVGAISVGALGQTTFKVRPMRVASFSNTRPIVVAPGVGILSAKAGGGYEEMDGTSMAAAHVTGVAALWADQLFAQNNSLDIDLLTVRLKGSATPQRGWTEYDYGLGLVKAPR